MNKENNQNMAAATNICNNRPRLKDSTLRPRNIRLPTPPPDPTTKNSNKNPLNSEHNIIIPSTSQIDLDDAMNKESELLEYLLSLFSQKSSTVPESDTKQSQLIRSNSLFAQAIRADEAFDHLDKLYKLMEQLLNLREQNSKLQKRVQDLEHLKKLQDMNLKLTYDADDKIILHDLEADPDYAESLLDNILATSRNSGQKRSSKYKPTRVRHSILSVRPQERSCSMAMDDSYSPYHNILFTYSDGNIYSTNKSSGVSKPANVSKWKKVKAAFKWEKASSTVGVGSLPVAKSQDNGLGLPILNNEVAKYLRVPSIIATGDSAVTFSGGVSPTDSVFSGKSSPGSIRTPGKDTSISETPASLSAASSTEDFRNHEIDKPQEDVLIKESNRQRFSTCSDEESLQNQRRSKSFDEDTILGKDEDSIYYTKHWNSKMYKTPWSKVKDIIQARKDSLKKSRVRINSKVINYNHMTSDHGVPHNRSHRRSDSNFDVCSFSSEEFPEVFETPPTDEGTINFNSIEGKDSRNLLNENSRKITQNLQTKHQTPLLTLSILNCENDNLIQTPQIPLTSNNKNYLPPEVIKRYQDIICAEKIRPSYRHNSRWHQVKRAFLNKNVNNTVRNTEYKSLSTPASPTRNSSFFSEDPEGNDTLKYYLPFHSTRNKLPQSITNQQEEIQKNYEELQNKLRLEFQENMLEWERLKATTTSSRSFQTPNVFSLQNTASIPTADVLGDPQISTEVDNASKAEYCDRMKPRSPNSCKFKESFTSPITSSDHLSAEFKKKLQEWQRIKKEKCTPLQHSASTKKRITDNFQFFKAGATPRSVDHSKTFPYPDTKQLSEDFLKKLEEWKHMKATNTVPSFSGYREDDDENFRQYPDAKSSSPDFKRKEITFILKSPRQSTKTSKFHEHKELQILEKEIQKIEREKQRLEREREKYLERDERLVKLRRSIGGHQSKKEVLVQTSTGFFRFQGISRKFTQRLYEWEKARGIGPEESTLTLLSPNYKSTLPGSNTTKAEDKNQSHSQGKFVRSKSMDSVANLSSSHMTTCITHQPSSLSLNDMEELEAECLAETHVNSICDHLPDIDTFEEPEAVIVDVEAIEEETAAPLENNIGMPECVTHTPVYRYEQQEDDRLCEGEECLAPKVQGEDSTKSQSCFQLIEKSISLLKKLKDKGEICKQLEADIEYIQGKLNNLQKPHNELDLENVNLRYNQKQSKIQELERKKQRLRNEGVNLQISLTEHKAQQTLIAQHLVDSMQRLQLINISVTSNVPKNENTTSNQQLLDDTDMIQDLSSELLFLSEKLQLFLNQRNNENVNSRNDGSKKLTRIKQWRSVDSDTEPTTIVHKTFESTDVIELENSLTYKILKLKRALSYIFAAQELTTPKQNKKIFNRKKYNSTSNETLSTNKDKIIIEKSDSVPNVTLSRRFHSKNDDIKLKTNVKRKIRIRSKYDFKYIESDDDESNFDENTIKLNRRHKFHKRALEEDNSRNKSGNRKCDNKSETVTSKNVLVDTNSQFVKYENNFRSNSPVDVLVKTTKTVFLPPDLNFEIKEETKKQDNETLFENSRSNNADTDANKNDIDTFSSFNKDIQGGYMLPKTNDMSPIQSPTLLLQRRLFKSRTCLLACEENSPSTSNNQDSENNILENLIYHPRNLLLKTLSSDAVKSSLPPLPHSPTPLRRDRGQAKETAPSIRLMIARYNQRLCEQDGGKSPGGSSESVSPVAWRSPVLERRVRAQTEKYQDEIRRILQNGSWKKYEITKSASADFIQTTVVPLKKTQTSMEAILKIADTQNTTPLQQKLSGILKSCAGSLKINNQAREINTNSSRTTPPKNDDKNIHQKLNRESKLQTNQKILENKSQNIIDVTKNVRSLSVTNTPTNVVPKCGMRPVSPKDISSLPESTQNSPNSLRALKIQRAKEDFFATQISSPEFTTAKSDVSSEPDSKKQNKGHFDINYVTVANRLSQASCGSESSCDNANSEGILIKSASAGMINIDANAYRQLATSEMHLQGYVSLPRSNRSHKNILGDKFGISSITSKFRKVKIRRHKDKDASKLNTISVLCRQSLFVDINDLSGELLNNSNIKSSVSREYPTVERGRSNSASSSPVFQRQLSDSCFLKNSSSSEWKSKF